jgi:hypothetical protein
MNANSYPTHRSLNSGVSRRRSATDHLFLVAAGMLVLGGVIVAFLASR